jgi:hypothetical protein
MKIRPVGAELFHTDGQDDLIVAFLNFAYAPKKFCKYTGIFPIAFLIL